MSRVKLYDAASKVTAIIKTLSARQESSQRINI
jgi:hypothetical protein